MITKKWWIMLINILNNFYLVNKFFVFKINKTTQEKRFKIFSSGDDEWDPVDFDDLRMNSILGWLIIYQNKLMSLIFAWYTFDGRERLAG